MRHLKLVKPREVLYISILLILITAVACGTAAPEVPDSAAPSEPAQQAPAAAQPHVVEFIRNCCERLGGDPGTDVPQYVDAMIQGSPYMRPDDSTHFIEGLRLAGLPVPTRQ